MCGCKLHGNGPGPCTCQCSSHAAYRRGYASARREWQPGDVAMIRVQGDDCDVLGLRDEHGWAHLKGYDSPLSSHSRWTTAGQVTVVRPLVVIDPEDREQIAALMRLYYRDINGQSVEAGYELVDSMQAALRELVAPTPRPEPTDPKARVDDRRGNTWRLLADGDWVCIYGPDHGEYLDWAGLAAERGPLTIEVPA